MRGEFACAVNSKVQLLKLETVCAAKKARKLDARHLEPLEDDQNCENHDDGDQQMTQVAAILLRLFSHLADKQGCALSIAAHTHTREESRDCDRRHHSTWTELVASSRCHC